MNDDLELRLRESFGRVSLPPAPDRLLDELERVTTIAVARRRRDRSSVIGVALGLAAVLLIAGALAVTVGQRGLEAPPTEAPPTVSLTVVPQPVDGRLPTLGDSEAAAEVVRRRLAAVGFDDALVTVGPGGSLLVDLPAGADRKAAVQLITAPGRIEFVGTGDFQPAEGQTVDLLEPPLFEGDAIVAAEIVVDELGGRALDLTLDERAARIVADFSANNVGGVLTIAMDDTVVVAPMIQAPILDGRIRIVSGQSGGLDEAMARDLVAIATSGPLPVPLAEAVRGDQPGSPVP